MKYWFSVLVSLIGSYKLSGQVIINANNNSFYNTGQSVLPVVGLMSINNTRAADLTEGSPFFQKEWIESTLVTENKTVYNKIPIRIDLLNSEVHYQDSSGKEFILSTPLTEILLQPSEGKMVHFINGKILPVAKKGWYVLLYNDSFSLVKGYKKTLDEHTSYGSAPEYRIVTAESYFIYRNNKEFEVSKPSDFVKIWPEKQAEINAFLKHANNKISREKQLLAVTKFINALGN